MKRGAPLRRTALKPGRGNPIPKASRDAVRARSQGWCEARIAGVCTGRAEHMHHIQRRREGTHDPSQLVHLCAADHRWVHGHPAAARDAGLIRSAVA